MTKDEHRILIYEMVDRFRGHMIKEMTQSRNLEKTHWSKCSNDYLLRLIDEKVVKLKAYSLTASLSMGTSQSTKLLVDIANLSAMIRDNLEYGHGNKRDDYKGETHE